MHSNGNTDHDVKQSSNCFVFCLYSDSYVYDLSVSRDRPLRLRLEVPSEVPSDKPEEINQELLMRGLARPAKQRQPAREEPVQLEIEETRDGMLQQEGPFFGLFI